MSASGERGNQDQDQEKKQPGDDQVEEIKEPADQEEEITEPAVQEEEEKPVANQGLYIELNVNDQWGNKVYFKMKRTGQLGTLLNAYCDRQSVDIKTIVFLFDGRLVRAHLTPDELDMKDGDAIDAMLHQIGGGFQFL